MLMTPTKPAYHCGLALTIEVLDGKWKPLILWHLYFGPAPLQRPPTSDQRR